MNLALFRSPVFWMRVVGLVVVVSLGLALAQLTWRLVGWEDGRTEIATPAALAPVSGGPGGSLAAAVAWNPFAGGGVGSDGLPISNLGLSLRGIVYAASGASTALISSGDGPVQVFAVGETPIGDAVIEAIEPERVILSVAGRREALLLPKPAGTPAGAPGTVGAPPPPSGPAPMAPAPAPQGPAAPAPAAAVAAPTAARPATPPPARVLAASAEAIDSLGIAFTGQGYRIGADSAPQLLRAGLRPGDEIRSVNGAALGDPDADREIFRRAVAGNRVRVEIVRDGQSINLTVPLR
jgi:general secretion pathway protein C